MKRELDKEIHVTIVPNEIKLNTLIDQAKDYVIFMTAYRFDTVIKEFPLWKHNRDFSQLFADCHITSISTKNFLQTKMGSYTYEKIFDPKKLTAQFLFKTFSDKDQHDFSDEIKQIYWQFPLIHSSELLLNNPAFCLFNFITFDKFLVSIKSQWFQVNPIAFFLNNTLFIEFELINCETKRSLAKDDVYGRIHNFNVIPVDSVRYLDEEKPTDDTRKIPSLILDNILRCLRQLTHRKYKADSLNYVNNLFVISNSITNIDTYFTDVLGIYGSKPVLDNLNTNKYFKYFSQEYLGVVIEVSHRAYQEAFFHCQILEALKMYFLLTQIVNMEITKKLTDTVNNQLYLEQLPFTSGLPIITLNALRNMGETPTFKRYKEAIEFKISYLHLQEEQRENRNGIILNVLIYILTFISGIGSWQVFQAELGIPFKYSAIVMSTIFAVLGIIWVVKEKRK